MSTYQFDEEAFTQTASGTQIEDITGALEKAIKAQGNALKHGHLPCWENAVNSLADTTACGFIIRNGAITIEIDPQIDHSALAISLRELMPWRKGPYQLGSLFIDTEWRSDWKWERLSTQISPLAGRCVLDVGCGSGYHMWRMRKEGAKVVLGIDPSLLYVKQFDAIQHFIQDDKVFLLPLPMESLPNSTPVFDTVFSMGVLYHRRNPLQHLYELHSALVRGGELILETLVVPGTDDESTVIAGRYANMRNIYELPTVKRLYRWIEEMGFAELKVADITTTSCEEQRRTAWIRSFSLAEALDPTDSSKTVEGYPRPLRAVLIATK